MTTKHRYHDYSDSVDAANVRKVLMIAGIIAAGVGGCIVGRTTYPERYGVTIRTSESEAGETIFEGYSTSRQIGYDGNSTIYFDGRSSENASEEVDAGLLEVRVVSNRD